MLKKSLVQNAIVLCIALPFALPLPAQVINDNLSFEKYDRQQHIFTDWYMSNPKEGHYIIDTDSSISKEGRPVPAHRLFVQK